jgi:hypothetical protein
MKQLTASMSPLPAPCGQLSVIARHIGQSTPSLQRQRAPDAVPFLDGSGKKRGKCRLKTTSRDKQADNAKTGLHGRFEVLNRRGEEFSGLQVPECQVAASTEQPSNFPGLVAVIHEQATPRRWIAADRTEATLGFFHSSSDLGRDPVSLSERQAPRAAGFTPIHFDPT